MINEYLERILEKLQQTIAGQSDALIRCAARITESVAQGGVVHLFGTGHSHMMAEELFYRAGGLAPVNAILEPAFMLHDGAELGTQLERVEGLADYLFRRHDIRSGDVMIVISNSGRNPVPLEMALLAKNANAYTIGMGSLAYHGLPSRHQSGLKLPDIVDTFLDNGSEIGDACLSVGDTKLRVGATSTVVGAALLNAVVVEVAGMLHREGCDLPFFISANGDENSDDHNHRLMERYRGRVRSF